MSNDNLSSIRTAISSILATVTWGASQAIQYIGVGRQIEINGFPACLFYLSGMTESIQDNKTSYWRTYRFGVDILQEFKNKDRTAAEQDFQDCIQAILDAFDANPLMKITGITHCDSKIFSSGAVTYDDFWFGPGLKMSMVLEISTFIG